MKTPKISSCQRDSADHLKVAFAPSKTVYPVEYHRNHVSLCELDEPKLLVQQGFPYRAVEWCSTTLL